MKLSVKEFADLTGVSVRTLHYYDKIGLLSPDYVDGNNGYRYYSEPAMMRMQQILFYRELNFSLDEIGRLLDSAQYDRQAAIRSQKQLLMLKRDRLNRILSALDAAEKGENDMNFDAFDNSDFEQMSKQYRDEARARWSNTDVYKEHEAKTADYTESDWQKVDDGINGIIAEFSELKQSGVSPIDAAAAALAARLQNFITATQYTCTDEIFMSLAEMYVADERFKRNIDRFGDGTAEFISLSIKAYCSR